MFHVAQHSVPVRFLTAGFEEMLHRLYSLVAIQDKVSRPAYMMQKKLVAVHSVMNKVTGALLFTLPLTLRFIELRYSVIVVCAVATFAAVQEGHYIRTGKEVE